MYEHEPGTNIFVRRCYIYHIISCRVAPTYLSDEMCFNRRVQVVAKMPPAAAPALMAAEPTLVSTLVGFLNSWHMPLRAAAANALARLAQSGPPARAAVMDAGTAPLLVQMLQMQTAETRVPGTRLLQRLADDEDARVVLVEAGAIEVRERCHER